VKAAEIRAEAAQNIRSFADSIAKDYLHPITVAQYGAAMEIAAQLAELNEKLEPARLVTAIEEIQDRIDELDRRRNDSGGGPP
jgi:hypothetical protein